MLITNFSAGELSHTLFGRIDIPQYFSGASRLENFDVIPTGGIKRRPGTELIKKLDEGDGRIIPFIVNRNFSFLLYLTPDKTTIIKLENENNFEVTNYESTDDFKLYKKISEINEVQYAQNYDTMILCHENYPPIEIKLENDKLLICKLKIDFNVPIIYGKNITENDIAKYETVDEVYTERNELTTDGNYPSTVSFFHGRLVFACTKNYKQKVYVSAIKQPYKNYNFSTYKIFLTEKREYSTLFGKIRKDDTSIIETESEYIINSFMKPPEDYFVDSQLFVPGTRIEYINLNMVKLSNGMKTPEVLLDINSIITDIKLKVTSFNNANDKPTIKTIYKRNTTLRNVGWEYVTGGALYTTIAKRERIVTITCSIKAHSIKIITLGTEKIQSSNVNETLPISNEWEKILPDDAAKHVDTYINQILAKINEIINHENNFDMLTHLYNTTDIDERITYQNEITNSLNKLSENVSNLMYYQLDTGYGIEKYYDYPEYILARVSARITNTDKTYIALYTREIINDSYPTPDCGFTFEIASDMNDAIQWLAVNKGLIIGTETSEWIIPPGVHATNVQATMNSRYGSDKIQGTAVGDATCFFQTGKKALVEYHIPQQDTLFRANNMAMMSENMLRESPAKEFDYLSSPYTKLFITREDGSAVTLLYERSTGTFAWGRFTTNGEIKSAAVIPGSDGYDELYLIVKRDNNYFLEVLRESCEVYLDCYKKYYADMSGYSGDAIINDGFIGYPYTSRVRSMPVLANDKMKPNNIKNIVIRFLDSFMPKLKSLPNEAVDTISCKEPYTGVWKTMFPGVWDKDVMFELIHDYPTRCKILAINTEVN